MPTVMAKIDKEIENDEELTQARRKIELQMKDRNVTVKGELKDYSQAGLADQLGEARALPELAELRRARVLNPRDSRAAARGSGPFI